MQGNEIGNGAVAVRPIEQIEAEILAHTQTATYSFIAIGRALIEAKEQLSHGEWLPWLRDRIHFSVSTANNFMRIAREIPPSSPLTALPYTKALALLEVPAEEREQFAAENKATERSAAALKRAIKERDDAIKRADAEAKRAESLAESNERLREETAQEIERAHKERQKIQTVPPSDYETIKKQLVALTRRAEQAEEYAAETEEALRAVQQEAQRAQMAQIDAEAREPDDPLAVVAFAGACTDFLSALSTAPLMGGYFASKSREDLGRYEILTSSVQQWAARTMEVIQDAMRRGVVNECEGGDDYEVR